MAEIAGEEYNRHSAFAERALDYVTAGEARFEALLQVIHEFTILARCLGLS